MIKGFENFVNENYRMHAHISNNSDPSKIIERKVSFTKKGFDEFNELATDHKIEYKKLLSIIKDMIRNPDNWKPTVKGIGGKVEILSDGNWSKRITQKTRLVYKLTEHDIIIYSCIGHYDDK